jgi:hypothetical protein
MSTYIVTERSTAHGNNTPHGFNTPHRFPTADNEEDLTDVFAGLARQLYPNGRVWWLKNNSNFDLFHKAINRSFIRLIEDARLELDGVFPDNDNFLEADAGLWEFRLGLITNESLTIEQRRQSILRKLSFPANTPARQSPGFIEFQLQSAGFNVFVHENTIPYRTPDDIIAGVSGQFQHGGSSQHAGASQHGALNFEVIANSLDRNEVYTLGGEDRLFATFFIGGQTLGETADVPESRIFEFRELVLKLKPAQMAAFTFINFV